LRGGLRAVIKNEQSELSFESATEVYVTGPSWPSTAGVSVSDAPMNPWSKQHWNLTRQGEIYRQDQAKAMRLARVAGHNHPISARFENAE
jgi:hypothetical protein